MNRGNKKHLERVDNEHVDVASRQRDAVTMSTSMSTSHVDCVEVLGLTDSEAFLRYMRRIS